VILFGEEEAVLVDEYDQAISPVKKARSNLIEENHTAQVVFEFVE